MNLLAYLARRLGCFVAGELACAAPRCGRRQVGWTQFCRRHVNEILHGDREPTP